MLTVKKMETDAVSTSNTQPVEETKNKAEEEKKSEEEKDVEEAAVSPTNFSTLLDDLSLPGSVISRISTPTPSFVGVYRCAFNNNVMMV